MNMSFAWYSRIHSMLVTACKWLAPKTVPPEPPKIEPVQGPLLPPQDEKDCKKTLVLDLDETLIHSSMTSSVQCDFMKQIWSNGMYRNVYVHKRPYVDVFLRNMSKLYEIIVFTASEQSYAKGVIEMLDDQKVVQNVLCRQHCTKVKNTLVKDLSRLGRDLKDIIIVDNNPTCYYFQPQNAVNISSWYKDTSDIELQLLENLLIEMATEYDVRDLLLIKQAKHFKNKARRMANDVEAANSKSTLLTSVKIDTSDNNSDDTLIMNSNALR